MRQPADPYRQRWSWTESLPAPALVFGLPDCTVVFANRLLLQLTGSQSGQVEGSHVSSITGEIRLPQAADLQRWLSQGPQDDPAAGPFDLEVDPDGAQAFRALARFGAADGSGQHVLLTIQRRAEEHPGSSAVTERLREQLAADALERDVLAGVGRLTSSPIHFSRVLAGMAQELSRILPATHVTVHEAGTAGRLALTHEWPAGSTPRRLMAEADDPGLSEARKKCVRQQSPVTVGSPLRESDGSSAAVIAPLLIGNFAFGTMSVFVRDVERLTPRNVALVSRLAEQVAGALHTTRTYQEKQRETELRRTLAAVGLSASQDLELPKVLERVANEIAELVRYDLMAVAIAEPDRSELSVRYQVGAEIQIAGYSAKAGAGMPLQLLPTARTAALSEGEEGFEELAAAGFQSLLEVSLGSHEAAIIGYMALASGDSDAFSQADLELMRHLAAQVTPAVQNALAHEQSVALADARAAEANAEARSRELERLNDAKSRFLGIVSHELRTPLTSIIAYTDLLRRNPDGNLSEKQVTQAAVINQSASHLKFLISDLLDVSRIESGNFSLDMSQFDLRDLIEEVAGRLQPVLAEKQQELQTHVARGRLEIKGDRQRVAQVVSNLVENASKYSPPETVITLDVHRRRQEVLVSVTDHGIGISVEDQQQLFTPFFRANSELTRAEPGTGLGLSLVKRITDLHGGTVSVSSKPGEGSTFTIALRAAKAPSSAQDGAESAAA